MGKLRKQLRTATPMDRCFNRSRSIPRLRGPVRLKDLGLDWLEKTHMRLATGEPEKGLLHVRLITLSDHQQAL